MIGDQRYHLNTGISIDQMKQLYRERKQYCGVGVGRAVHHLSAQTANQAIISILQANVNSVMLVALLAQDLETPPAVHVLPLVN